MFEGCEENTCLEFGTTYPNVPLGYTVADTFASQKSGLGLGCLGGGTAGGYSGTPVTDCPTNGGTFTPLSGCIVNVPCRADLTNDYPIATDDLLLLLSQFGLTCRALTSPNAVGGGDPLCSADLKPDGRIDVEDVILMLSQFGMSCLTLNDLVPAADAAGR